MKKFSILIVIIFFFISCKHQQDIAKHEGPKPIVLVSKDFNQTMQNWLQNSIGNNGVICINMYAIKTQDSIRMLLKKADGIIISGGEDVNPELYGKETELSRCSPIDSRRDSLEQMMIRFAMNRKIPLLGICRGHQILNVTQGGSLIIDIPVDVGSLYIHRDSRKANSNKSTAVNHMVYIENGTFLYNIVKVDSGEVLSNHHQAVDKLAPFYKISSIAKDKVIESIEPADTLLHPFILGVQWHPEGMDVKNLLSGNIGRKFMSKVKQHNQID